MQVLGGPFGGPLDKDRPAGLDGLWTGLDRQLETSFDRQPNVAVSRMPNDVSEWVSMP
jgi:hypothetical protein